MLRQFNFLTLPYCSQLSAGPFSKNAVSVLPPLAGSPTLGATSGHGQVRNTSSYGDESS